MGWLKNWLKSQDNRLGTIAGKYAYAPIDRDHEDALLDRFYHIAFPHNALHQDGTIDSRHGIVKHDENPIGNGDRLSADGPWAKCGE